MSNHNLRVALVWNDTVFHEKTFTQTSDPIVLVGEDEKNHFTVPAEGIPDAFEMFQRTDKGYNLRFTDKLEGISVTIGDEEHDAEDLIESATKVGSSTTASGAATLYEIPIGFDDWGIIPLGNVKIFFQLMEKGEVIAGRAFGDRFEGTLVGTLLVATILHAAFLISAHMFFEVDTELRDMRQLNRFVKIMVDEPKDPLEELELEEPEEDTTGKKAGGEEGKFGDEESEIEDSKVPKTDGEMVQEIDVKNIGVNKALSSDILGAGPLKNIFGNSEGFDAKMNVAMSGEGDALVVGRGAGGMGMRGLGKGGGGEGFGRIHGLGKVDTGGGKGTGGKIGTKKKRTVKPKMAAGTPEIGDFCDRGNISRVVGGKRNAIQYCFEKELQTNPTLGGKIVAQWRVGLDGAVMSASIASTTMNNRSVEGCIARVIQRLRFEKPNGGICIIEYPFVFSGLEE